jgi:hypothetical protein
VLQVDPAHIKLIFGCRFGRYFPVPHFVKISQRIAELNEPIANINFCATFKVEFLPGACPAAFYGHLQTQDGIN